MRSLNLCTSVLPGASFEGALEIARTAGYTGIELRVDDGYHASLAELLRDGERVRRAVEAARLKLPVLSSYIPLDDERSVEALLAASAAMGVPRARVVLPRSGQAAVVRQAKTQAVIPSYEAREEPQALLSIVRARLERLERAAARAGVQVLLELHWGTVMSSFSSAYFFLNNLHPACVALTFDPANMLVEGKEDWEYGLKLVGSHLANVHVKNVRWDAAAGGWEWAWAPLALGMVDWPGLLALLKRGRYDGDYAMEDFLTPSASTASAVAHLATARSQFLRMLRQTRLDSGGWASLVPANTPFAYTKREARHG